MKRLFCILLTFLFFISCNKKESENVAKSITEINLSLKGYRPSEHKSFIDLTIENFIAPVKKQLKISESGVINYTFLNKNKKELIFNYNNREFSLIVSPNEKITIELNIEELLNWSKFKNFNITGSNKKTNSLILTYTSYLDSLIKQSTSFFIKDSSLTNMGFKNKRILEMKNQLQSFNTLISTENINDKTFIDWSKAQIRYKAGSDLNHYISFRINPNPDINENNPYFDFVNEIGFNSNDQLTYKVYLDYLESLTGSYNLIGNWSNKYKRERELLKNEWPTNYFLKLNLIKRFAKGKDRDIIMAYLFKNEIRLFNYTGKEMPENYIDTLKLYTSQIYVSQLFQKKNSTKKTIETLIKEYDISQEEKKGLLEVYKYTKNKVIFHDFWATWCAPCMNELPYYNDLIKMTSDDVVYIFYGVHMEENEWKKTIENFNLKGKHYLLTNNQLAFFEKYFLVHGFPHHQIINSNGLIVEEQIPNIAPRNFNFIKKLIDKNSGLIKG